MLGAEVGHILAFPATRGFGLGLPRLKSPQQYWDNADGINRFTGSGTITNQLTRWFTQRAIVGIDYTGEDARALEKFAAPALSRRPCRRIRGGRIGQTLRHNTIITTDYNGTAKFDLTSAISSSSSIGGQFYRTELNASALGGAGFPGPGVETVSGVAQIARRHSNTNAQHDDRRLHAGASGLARSRVHHRRGPRRQQQCIRFEISNG